MDALSHELSTLMDSALGYVAKLEQAQFEGTPYDNLTLAELRTIEAISLGEKSMGEVASALEITLSSLNTTVNRLFKKGYVGRERPEQDRRRVLLRLTRPGQEVYSIHTRYQQSVVAKIVGDFDHSEREILVRALSRLRIIFQTGPKEPRADREVEA